MSELGVWIKGKEVEPREGRGGGRVLPNLHGGGKEETP